MGKIISCSTIVMALVSVCSRVEAVAIRPGFNASSLAANDDGSTGLTPLGFSANFFGATYTDAFLNNNGNITFGSPLSTFTPFGLSGPTTIPIIAAYFGDVDTRGIGSDLLRYGSGMIGGRPAFGVTWGGVGVGYFSNRVDKLNKFQLILIERSDTGAGNFDIEFNYDQIEWETGEASGGVLGLGGSSARVGYSNGSGVPGSFFELPGSGVNGAFLDSSVGPNRLISNSLGASIDRGVLAGQYTFQARNGTVSGIIPEPTSLCVFGCLGMFGLVHRTKRKGRGSSSI
jgi:hypothetical protein